MGCTKKPKRYSSYKSCNWKKLCSYSLGGKEDVNDAVLAAKEAFKTWGFSSKDERVALLENFYALYKKR